MECQCFIFLNICVGIYRTIRFEKVKLYNVGNNVNRVSNVNTLIGERPGSNIRETSDNNIGETSDNNIDD